MRNSAVVQEREWPGGGGVVDGDWPESEADENNDDSEDQRRQEVHKQSHEARCTNQCVHHRRHEYRSLHLNALT